jgi:6-phosphogluconolactonase
VPGDPVVEVADRDVAVTGTYRGWRRLTLTRPTLDLARTRLWVVAGAGKADAVARLVAADATIPAGRVAQHSSVLVVDRAAAAQIPVS